MARYRKAVYNAIWVQLALVACYVPQFIVRIVTFLSAKRFSNLFLIYGMGIFILFFNSTLNPFLYCWKISEVRRAVKQTIRQAICFAEGQTYFNVGMYCFFYNLYIDYAQSLTRLSDFIVIKGMADVLVVFYFNSTLNPFLCCKFKSILITNFEYSREIRDSITGRVHKAGLMRKHSLIS